ncbi:MAG: shikimate dehydrogenase [Candidatus Zixiibacteriota bacterium]|nr:MAG: shikimate dehydrogenase [candidate division Zixibacteria bacterium]
MKQAYKFGVVGYNVGYSQSPDLFRAISTITNIECSCNLHDISPDDFKEKLPQLLKSDIDGFSVTIPHKQRIIPFLAHIDASATMVGAVNSVAVRDGNAYGYNTDSHGFGVPLSAHSEILENGTALVFGAGGAAMAVVHCLHTDYRVRCIFVCGRNPQKLRTFTETVRQRLDVIDIRPVEISEFDVIAETDYDIVVNGTPLGGWNHPDDSPFPRSFNWRPGKIYYDLSYNAGNKLVARAADHSMIAYDGSIMLIGQALRSVFLWTGQEVPFDPVYEAVFGGRR